MDTRYAVKKTLFMLPTGPLGGLVTRVLGDAGWSSPVARQAHNLKVAGSNPAPATNEIQLKQGARRKPSAFFNAETG